LSEVAKTGKRMFTSFETAKSNFRTSATNRKLLAIFVRFGCEDY